jgi:GNAT superfamily N-acetyltransferase
MSHCITTLAAIQIDRRLDRLVGVLKDAIESGAAPGFTAPLGAAEAVEYWLRVRAAVVRGSRLVLADADVRGVVEMELGIMPAARHRALVTKLFVCRESRGLGLGRALVEAAERSARAAGRTLFVLDTRPGDVTEQFYERLGYVRQSANEASLSFYRELA